MAISGATIIEHLSHRGEVIDFTCANDTGISKGDILELADDRTAKASTGEENTVAGIVAADKEANDGAVNVGCYRHVIADCFIQETILKGEAVAISSGNVIKKASNTSLLSAGSILGICQEDGTRGEWVEVLVNL